MERARQQAGHSDTNREIFSEYQGRPVEFAREVLGASITDDIARVMESVRDNTVTVAKSGNATGKTHAAAHLAIWFYKSYPGAQVYTAAAPPEDNLKRLLWGEIGKIIDRRPDLFERDRISLSMNVQRSATEFITGVTIPNSGTPEQREARFSGKHAPYLFFIVDEGDAVPIEVYRGIESCMSGGHVRLLVLFNPRAKSGPLYMMERAGTANIVQVPAITHPNVVTGRDVIPGAVSREITVRRINEWTRPLRPGESEEGAVFEVPDYLVGATAQRKNGTWFPPLPAGKRRVVDAQFSYMVLAEYPPQAPTQLINEDDIAAARSRWDLYVAKFGHKPPPGIRPLAGLDVAEFGDDENALCVRYGGWVDTLRVWSGVDVLVTGDRAAGEFKNRKMGKIFVDATGVGAGVAPQIRRTLRTLGVTVNRSDVVPVMVASKPTIKTELGEFFQLRDQLWWSLREWLRTDPGAMLPPDQELIDELLAPSYEIKNGKIKVSGKDEMRQKLQRSPNRADALALTFAPESPKFRVEFV